MAKQKRILIRYKTWYWGNCCYILEGESIPTDFEEYSEAKHGWQHSEEFSKGCKINPREIAHISKILP